MPKKSNSHFPTRASLIEATFKAITGCGGSATNDEIQEHVIEILELPDHIINMMYADILRRGFITSFVGREHISRNMARLITVFEASGQ